MKQEPYSDLKKKYKKVKPEDAKDHWEGQFASSSHTCSHAYWSVGRTGTVNEYMSHTCSHAYWSVGRTGTANEYMRAISGLKKCLPSYNLLSHSILLVVVYCNVITLVVDTNKVTSSLDLIQVSGLMRLRCFIYFFFVCL